MTIGEARPRIIIRNSRFYSTFARTSDSRMIRYSFSPTLTSLPPYLA